MKLEKIELEGKKIIIINWHECKDNEEMIKLLSELKRESILKKASELLTLDDFTDTFVSSKFMKEAKKYGKEIFSPQRKKGAIIGITGIKKILLESYNLFTNDKLVPFNSKQEALDYLCK